MKLAVVAVGIPRDKHLSGAIREYESRASRYYRIEIVEVSAARASRGGGPPAARAEEADRLRERTPTDLETWALTRHGETLSSKEFAAALAEKATYGHPGIAFLIGGAYGLDEDLVRDCARSFSLSRLTLPHELARLVLAEQIYRSGTIQRGEPYHKGESR